MRLCLLDVAAGIGWGLPWLSAPRRNKNGLRFTVTPFFIWWALLDLNQRPTDYESAALPAELKDGNESFAVLQEWRCAPV